MAHEQKVVYYQDINEDFLVVKRKPKVIDENYKFINKNPLWKLCAFFVYRVVMTPFVFIFSKFKYRTKIYNKKILKKYKKVGYFLYGNHTNTPFDAFIPTILTFPKAQHVVVHPDNIALKGTENLLKMMGALPLPTTISGIRPFTEAMEKRIVEHNCVTIYPEAHVWQYYTKIRPFKATSFKYPVKFDDPVFCFTMCYKKRKHGNKPEAHVYVDGPFFSDQSLSPKDSAEKLRDEVYNIMVERSKNSDIEVIKYIKKEVEE